MVEALVAIVGGKGSEGGFKTVKPSGSSSSRTGASSANGRAMVQINHNQNRNRASLAPSRTCVSKVSASSGQQYVNPKEVIPFDDDELSQF